MTSRERIQKIMNFEVPDRIGIFDWHWAAALNRWREEGLPEDANLSKHFGYDMISIGVDSSFRLERKILEETEETYIERNSFGMTQRQWKGEKQGAPHQIDTVVKTRSDWEGLKNRFMPSSDRFEDNVVQKTRQLHEEGYWINYWYLEPFELVWRFFGFKETLMLMAEDPEFLSELFEACADQVIDNFDEAVARGAEFDGNFAGGDLAGKNGPLFSPRMYRELLMPHHRRIFQHFNNRGVPTFYHGDGDERELLDSLIEAGVVAMHPLEQKAGMDLFDLKRGYGDKLVLFGGIDVRNLGGSREEIEKEIRTKVPVAMENGGYIYCVDHSVAPSVSYENYLYVLHLIREEGVY